MFYVDDALTRMADMRISIIEEKQTPLNLLQQWQEICIYSEDSKAT
jgi:hypothetical protein